MATTPPTPGAPKTGGNPLVPTTPGQPGRAKPPMPVGQPAGSGPGKWVWDPASWTWKWEATVEDLSSGGAGATDPQSGLSNSGRDPIVKVDDVGVGAWAPTQS